MFEILSSMRARQEQRDFTKRYLASQVTPDYGKGFKPILYKFLDTIGL